MSKNMDSSKWLASMLSFPENKKKKKSSSKRKRKRESKRSQEDFEHFKEMLKLSSKELKDMSQLSSIDDAFHLSWESFSQVAVLFIKSRRSPTLNEFREWDVYTRALYLKARSSREGKPPVSYESLKGPKNMEPIEPSSEEEEDQHMESTQPSTKGEDGWIYDWVMPYVDGPIKFGSYSSETKPTVIPHHLYLLVKEAADIMKRSDWRSNPNDLKDLATVEKKIRFFRYYFFSHLPTDWKYNRDYASKEVESYDTRREPKYNMSGYTPINSFRGEDVELECDEYSSLSRQDMIAIMYMIHSRETPAISKMVPGQIKFYCRMCSCFGIQYHRLEDASEDDVCLMNVGLHS
ncbi:hypothetical protein HanHA89_Chr04g0154801 [Helianthus annuus]|nr:hypothetical protein HanHA89_Chr04g0154801 [Helianthus annuus]